MSAASQSRGLAQSQDTMTDTTMEDPGRHWIDLVLAFKSGDPAKVREVLTQAKASQWTHELYSEALQGGADYSSEDGSGPEGNPWCDECNGPCVCGLVEL